MVVFINKRRNDFRKRKFCCRMLAEAYIIKYKLTGVLEPHKRKLDEIFEPIIFIEGEQVS